VVVYFSRLHRIARLRSDSNGARVESRIFQRGWVRRIQVRRPGELQSDAARSAVYEESGRNDCLRALPCPRALRQRPGTCAAGAAKDPVDRSLADFIFHAVRCESGCRCIDLEGDAHRQSRLHQSDAWAYRSPGSCLALGDPNLALGAVLVVTTWFLMGYYMIIFLSGLQDIPREYYEAARIDGANSWKMFTQITLPLLRPTSFFVLLVSTVSAVSGSQAFDLIYVMTNGGPANSTSLVVFYIYQQAFKFNNYGYAAAMASVLVVILLAITLVLFALTRGGRFHLQ